MSIETGLALSFLGTGLLVIAAGMLLARTAEVIGEHSGFGRVRIGAVLLAGATSLPELTTDITAVRIGAPDLAAGDLFGSSLANMLLLGVVALFARQSGVLAAASPTQRRLGALALVLNGLAGLLILAPPGGTLLRLGWGPVLLGVAYVVGMRHLHLTTTPVVAASPGTDRRSLRRAVGLFGVAAVVIFLAAPRFAHAAAGVAEATGLGDTFVGTVLVGLATSLPELAASAAAVRAGAVDLAVGNLFGSNAVNMLIFLPLELVHPGALFADLASAHAVSAGAAVALMGVALAVLTPSLRRYRLIAEGGPALLVAGYVLGLGLLYWVGVGG